MIKVFISYGDLADQLTALRLQALAAANGLTVYVPPAYTRRHGVDSPQADVIEKLQEADVVLGFVGNGCSEACREELNRGLALRKHMIVLASAPHEQELRASFGAAVVEADPANPHQSELQIVGHLRQLEVRDPEKKALLALGTLALGLLILAPASER